MKRSAKTRIAEYARPADWGSRKSVEEKEKKSVLDIISNSVSGNSVIGLAEFLTNQIAARPQTSI